MATPVCSVCSTEAVPGQRFCGQCGNALDPACAACGAPAGPGDRFCRSCGAPLVGTPQATAAATPAAPAGAAERRLVSVLFADLVAFTRLSEHRDPDQIHELVAEYFERCREIIERYGGIVEKFIGDAVMAVWGSPVAREDDAERAVRAALALCTAVTALGEEVGLPELRVRTGVLTGSAAVQVGAESEGMVLGDTVNTAARLQGLAEPGTVLVDDVTRRASESAVAYADAGTHAVKGRDQPLRTWTALRIIAGRGGARRSAGIEPPFAGREPELARIVAAAEASAREGTARLVTVIGEAGIGKSRLLWEYFKAFDGVEEQFFYHEGRCLSYGDGVAFWALAEIVRGRAGILEDEEPDSARAKLRASVERFVADERERRLVEPRLAHLLGLEDRIAKDLADLFSGWRLFFERMAEVDPVVLVLEDLHWADSGLLDFIDYLLEWSADHPIFILALARPELLDARPQWPADVRLAPLDGEAMQTLLEGLVPDLPEELGARIRQRAEGVPLYAVETLRMLLDRGLLAESDAHYVLTGSVEDLEVPETLHALVAARLDGLEPGERALVHDAAVLGHSFFAVALATVAQRSEADVTRTLQALVAKQVVRRVEDDRSAQRGQYAFLQALVRTIAYGQLSRRDRKARHLAAAAYFERELGEEAGEIAEVLAAHYLDAVEADPGAPDAPSVRVKARETLIDAGRRAISLALGPEARRHFEQAAALTESPADRAGLLRQAGEGARMALDHEGMRRLLSEAIERLEACDRPGEAARTMVVLADALLDDNADPVEIRALLERAAALDGPEDETTAMVHALRARVAFLTGSGGAPLQDVEVALRIADGQRLDSLLPDALVTKGVLLWSAGRVTEGTALMAHGRRLALDLDLVAQALRASFNYANVLAHAGAYAETAALVDEALALARERGDRQWEQLLQVQRTQPLEMQGRWDELAAVCEEMEAGGSEYAAGMARLILLRLRARRGQAAPELHPPPQPVDEMDDGRALMEVSYALGLSHAGDHAQATERALAGVGRLETLGGMDQHAFGAAVDVAEAAGSAEALAALGDTADGLGRGFLQPPLEAQALRARGLLAGLGGDARAAETLLRRAVGVLIELGAPFQLAQARVALAERLEARGEAVEAAELRAQASGAFEGLGARPWLQRARGGAPASPG